MLCQTGLLYFGSPRTIQYIIDTPKCRATDHLFTHKTLTLVSKYVKEKSGRQVFAYFIDFQKAHESVWHNGMFHKRNTKINGSFLYT